MLRIYVEWVRQHRYSNILQYVLSESIFLSQTVIRSIEVIFKSFFITVYVRKKVFRYFPYVQVLSKHAICFIFFLNAMILSNSFFHYAFYIEIQVSNTDCNLFDDTVVDLTVQTAIEKLRHCHSVLQSKIKSLLFLK